MKHLLIIGVLLVAVVAVYLSLNKGRLMDAARTVTSQAVPEHGASPTDRGEAPTPPIIAQPIGSNAIVVTSPAPLPAATNAWERLTAGRYADLIKEIRNARGNPQ